MSNEELKCLLKNMGVSQRDVVQWLIAQGYYEESARESLKTRVNLALNGKRSSDRYLSLLGQIETVVNAQVESCF